MKKIVMSLLTLVLLSACSNVTAREEVTETYFNKGDLYTEKTEISRSPIGSLAYLKMLDNNELVYFPSSTESFNPSDIGHFKLSLFTEGEFEENPTVSFDYEEVGVPKSTDLTDEGFDTFQGAVKNKQKFVLVKVDQPDDRKTKASGFILIPYNKDNPEQTSEFLIKIEDTVKGLAGFVSVPETKETLKEIVSNGGFTFVQINE